MTVATAVVRSLTSFPVVIALTLLPDAAAQHVCHDRGPGELLPPALRAGDAGAAAAGAPGPRAPGPAVPGPLDADLTHATFLWAFQRDALLPPEAAPALPAATTARVAQALLVAMRDTDSEVARLSLWSLARVARHDAALAGALHARLLDDGLLRREDPLGEAALVAAGLAARDSGAVLQALAAVAIDAKAAPRRRALAFYGLGLAAQEGAEVKTQFRVLTTAQRALLPPRADDAEVLVAALHAVALTRIGVAPQLAAPALEMLERAWDAAAPQGPIDFRAHVPIAVAAVVDRESAVAATWRERFVEAAAAERRSSSLARSCVVALGGLCRPYAADDSPDADVSCWLQDQAATARDQQLRYHALFALGQIAGARNREFLLGALGGNVLARPWAALGLAAGAPTTGDVDAALEAAIDGAAKRTRNPVFGQSIQFALRVVRREGAPDRAAAFLERYGSPLPGAGEVAATVDGLLATLADATATPAQRRLAAVGLGHLADPAARHWSTRLAAAVDYRSATPALLAVPNGVLRLP